MWYTASFLIFLLVYWYYLNMAGLGGFYKGEKKKKKKDSRSISSVSQGLGAPTFSMPKIIEKKRKDF